MLIRSPGRIYPQGIDRQILGYVERADGHCQVTVGGHPVYHYAGDTRPGDIRGQGRDGAWYAVGPAGERARSIAEPLAVPDSPAY